MKEEIEEWKPVPFEGFDKVYEVSNTGRVRTIHGKNERRLCKHKNGYMRLVLSHQGKQINITIHRLVALAFIANPNPQLYNQVGHWDDNKTNNVVSNLYWTNAQENNCHGSRLAKQTETADRKRKGAASHRKGKKIPVFEIIPTSISGASVVWFCSVAEASRQTGIPTLDIKAAINGIRESAGGYRWVKGYDSKGLETLNL